MTAVDGDGIDEDLTRAVSVAMLAAARAGEQIARMTQAAAREREARAAGNTAEAQRQADVHTQSAKAYFEVVTRPEYLSVATDEQIREVSRQAEAWRDRLPEAERAADVTSRESQERRPEQTDEQAAALAAEGEVADRRARESEGVQPPPERPERRAAATAKVAQARSASEAPSGARGRSTAGRGRRTVAGPRRSTDIQR